MLQAIDMKLFEHFDVSAVRHSRLAAMLVDGNANSIVESYSCSDVEVFSVGHEC